jgi:hypothetical protein
MNIPRYLDENPWDYPEIEPVDQLDYLARTRDPDPIVDTVRKRLSDRSAEGIRKYGCTMMRDDVTTVEWIDHAIEEALDFAVYLERLKLDMKVMNK